MKSHCKGTWGCAARKSAFSLGKGIILPSLVNFCLGKGMLFGYFGQRNVKLR